MAEQRQLDLILNLQDNASRELKGVRGQLEKLEPAFQQMAVVGTAALVGVGAVIKQTVGEAVFLGESINAVQVIFKDGADVILDFGKTAAKAVGMANGEFNQMATITGALLKDVGMPMEEVAEMTIELTKRAADMASVFNTDVEDAMSAVNQAIRGETEAIRRYAGDVTDATLETYLWSQGVKKSVTDLTQQEKRLWRVKLIMEQTKETANDFQNTSESLANKQRVLRATFKDISTTIGNNFIPMISDVLNKIEPIVTKMGEWLEQNPELTKKIILTTGAVAGLTMGLGFLGMAIITVAPALAMLMGPIGIILSILGLLSPTIYRNRDAIVDFVQNGIENMKKAWENLKPTLTATWEEFKVFYNIAKEALMPMFKDLWEAIKEMWTALKELWAVVGPLLTPVLIFLAKLLAGALYLAFVGIVGIVTSLATLMANTITYWVDKYKEFLELLLKVKDALGNIMKNPKEVLGDLGLKVMNTIGVNDAIISPNGDIITTHPDDYLIATKNPETLGGGGGTSISININGGTYLDRNAGEQLAELLAENLRRKLRI